MNQIVGPDHIAAMDAHNDAIGRVSDLFEAVHERAIAEMQHGEDCWTVHYDEGDKDEFICRLLHLVYAPPTEDALSTHESNTSDRMLEITLHCDKFVKSYAEYEATRAMENNHRVDQFMRALL